MGWQSDNNCFEFRVSGFEFAILPSFTNSELGTLNSKLVSDAKVS